MSGSCSAIWRRASRSEPAVAHVKPLSAATRGHALGGGAAVVNDQDVSHRRKVGRDRFSGKG